MIALNRIYTRTGDGGTTALGSGKRVSKSDLRIEAYGTVDETNAVLGLARLHTTSAELGPLDLMLARIQNELFDLGADLCLPQEDSEKSQNALRILGSQVERLEREIDMMNKELAPLRSFVLPGGHPAAAYLHLCRTICRRAERLIVALADRPGEKVSGQALAYINRLSDHFFVSSRWVNARGLGDVLWSPGATREG
jgi:cob(I)alamin adenosyltransferase